MRCSRLRGVRLVSAATVIAELGDITRFANPRQLMAYLGLVPSEHSSGGTRRQGGVTKAGNSTAGARVDRGGLELPVPRDGSVANNCFGKKHCAKPIRDTAWKAQLRLCGRYRKLTRAGKPATIVTTAIARELAGFVWAIACQLPRPTATERPGHDHPDSQQTEVQSRFGAL